MRVDIVSIFPEYFEPLRLSLVGRAVERGQLDVRVHQLRDFTHDVHRTVDDTPYGGGAGMVMKPEPWGEALDAVLEDAHDPLVLFTTPAGAVLTQARAQSLSTESHLVFCCGRYEGIDQRVVDYAASRWRTGEISIGDYVLNGGEVAVLVVVEAVARLIPGVIGNPESLTEESHNRGLLEHPSYTKPASWRGLDVPEVLTQGNHRAIADWQREASLARTRRMRPDLLGGHRDDAPDVDI